MDNDLLIPRIKIIAKIPDVRETVGTIITGITESSQGFTSNPWFLFNGHRRAESFFKEYPHLFKKLQWWEDRTAEELLSVKWAKTIAGNSVRTVKEIDARWGKIILDGGKVRPIRNWQPATEWEYRAFTTKTILC